MTSKKKKVYAYIHTHWDREWYREFEEFRLRLVEVFDDVLEKLERNEIPSFYFDGQTCALEDYLEIKPYNKDRVLNLIQEHRLFIGPYFCSTDSFLVDRESLIKNLQLGISDSLKFGCKDFIAYHADTFGHSKFIPEIVKYFGIDYAMFWRGLGELESEFLFRNLKSTYLIEGYFHDYFSANVSFEKKAEMLKRTLDRISKYSSGELLLPLGADHLAVCDNLKEQVANVNKLLEDYEIVVSSPFEYFDSVRNNFKKNFDCEFRDTRRNFILPGVLSSRIDLKQQNSRLQWELARLTQPLQAVTSYLGLTKSFQNEVDYLYKELIKNHPHDSIYGCSVDGVHRQNKVRFETVEQGSRALLNTIKSALYQKGSLSVVNLSNYCLNGALKFETCEKLDKKYNAQLVSKRKGFPLKKVYDVNQIPVTEDYTDIYEYLVDLKNIKPFSIKKIEEESINKVSTLKISDSSIENGNIALFVNDGKVCLKDKVKNVEYDDFIKFIDRADIGDSYNFGALKADKPVYSKVLSTKIKEQGHIRSILEITFEIVIPLKSSFKGRAKSYGKHTLKLDAVLENQNDYIEFNLSWQNKSEDHILQVEFNMKEPVTETVSDDLTGYTYRTFEPDYDIYSLVPAPRGIELKHNTAPFQKLLFVQGIGFITEGLQEYEVFKNKLRLTLLRATGTISNPYNPTRGTPAGPPLSTLDLQMRGEHSARFALGFKNSIIAFEKDVENFYQTAILLEADLPLASLFDISNEHIRLSTLKLNAENDLICRFVNMSDNSQKIEFKTNLRNNGLFEADSLENVVKNYTDKKVSANSLFTLLIKH